jgi:hypothetical protein
MKLLARRIAVLTAALLTLVVVSVGQAGAAVVTVVISH